MGVKKEDIDININDDCLTISADKKEFEGEGTDCTYHIRERGVGKCQVRNHL